jgi:hypothetical protein
LFESLDKLKQIEEAPELTEEITKSGFIKDRASENDLDLFNDELPDDTEEFCCLNSPKLFTSWENQPLFSKQKG